MATRKKQETVATDNYSAKSDLLERFVPILLVVSIGLAFVVGMLWQKINNLESGSAGTQVAGTGAQPAAVTVTKDQIKDVFSKDVIKLGNADSKLLFVEIADPSCPYCHIAAGKNPELNKETGYTLVADGGTYLAPVPEMKKLVDEGKAAFAWIYSPGHGNGELGTQAMYCAQEKGKFWEAHDILMTNAGYDFLNETVKNDVAKAGDMANFLASAVNPAEMKTCLESGKYKNRLAEDTSLARSLGVNGTPGFFVNETPFAGAFSFKDMETAVNAGL